MNNVFKYFSSCLICVQNLRKILGATEGATVGATGGPLSGHWEATVLDAR